MSDNKQVTAVDVLGKEGVEDLSKKKILVEKNRIENQYNQYEESQRETELLKNLKIDEVDEEYLASLSGESTEYLLSARNGGVFLNNAFKGKVPFFGRNIVLLAAETGSGKSTIVANVALNSILQKKRVLVLSNEEHPADFYNRVSALLMGIPYSNHEKFSDEQIDKFASNIKVLGTRLTVIGDEFKGIRNCTTSIEGLERLFEIFLKKGNEFDVILLDYYQNVDKSISNPELTDWQVQYRLCKILDQLKNKVKAPIIVLAQKKTSKDKELPFREAIEGRKTIMTVSTCAIDVRKDIENYRTAFEIKKSRFNDCVGDTIYVGFDKGRYVDYNTEFKSKANDMKMQKAHRELMSTVNPSAGFDKKDGSNG